MRLSCDGTTRTRLSAYHAWLAKGKTPLPEELWHKFCSAIFLKGIHAMIALAVFSSLVFLFLMGLQLYWVGRFALRYASRQTPRRAPERLPRATVLLSIRGAD